MSSTNRTLIILLLAVAGVAVYWFLLFTPKQDEIAVLDEQIAQLNTSIANSRQAIAAGEQAKESFADDYTQLVTLGKAVPDGDEQSALLVQLNQLGLRSDIFFSSISLEGSGSPAPPPSAPAPSATVEPSVTAPPGEEGAATAAPATESTVASLPIGANVGSAGLGVMPYNLLFTGNFFKLADFIAAIDGLVTTGADGRIEVNGRLMTINGFALNPASGDDLTKLNGSFSVTTFVTPAGQGQTAGATPAGPGTGAESAPVLTGGTP